ncbi:MAG: GAF domain-containing protein, partial [Nitrospinota bacterium]
MDLVFFLTITIRLLATTMSLVLAHRLRDWRIGFLAAMLALTLIHQGLMWWSATPAGGVSPIGALSEVSELAVSIMALLAILFLRRILGKGRQREAALQRQVDQTSALLEVGQAITGSLDLQEVLDMIVARACSLLHTQRAGLALITYEGNDMVPRFVAQRGLSSTFITRIRPRHWRDGTTFMAITKRRPIWSADLLNDPAFELTPGTRAAVEAEGYRAVLSVPLLSGDEVLGALVVYRDTPGPFTPEEVDLLQAFAAQATIAIKNAQLYRNLENRLARLQTLTRLNQFISSSLDIDTVLAEIARAAAVLLQAPSVSFWLADESREILELRAFWEEIADRERPQKILRFGQGGVGWVARHRQPLQIDDTFSDERIVGREWRKAYGFR